MQKHSGKILSLLLLATAVIWNPKLFGTFIVFSALPLFVFCVAVAMLTKKISEKTVIALIVLFAIALHIRNDILFSPTVLVDSRGFIEWGKAFAAGHGFPGMWYRPPLYSFLLGVTFFFSGDVHTVVILQRMMMVAAVPMTYLLARQWGFPVPAACVASLLFAMNSLVMQMSRSIIVESFFIFLVLVTLLVFTEFVRRPSWQGALAAGVLFALCAHCRQIATPLLILGLVILVLGNRKGRVMFALAAFAVYLCCCAPWSLRNQRLYGGYALSYHLGPNIFTKLTSFKLQDTDGKKFSIVKPVLLNVEQDLGIAGYAEPEHPEDNWDVNKIPHRMMDSLVKNHGYSYSNATGLLTAVSIEGFLRHPGLYARSIVKTGYALLFEHHETVPAIADVFPKSGYFPYAVRAPVRSFVTLDSFLFLLFVCFGLWKRERLVSAVWLPFLIVCYGYLSVAMVQVGFSRYAVPWTPFAAMIAAYVMSEAASSILPIKPKSAASSVAKRQYDEF